MAATEDLLRRHKGLRKYVLSDEEIVFATHRHWILLWEPVLTTLGSFAVFVLIFLGADTSMRGVVIWLFWGWGLVVVRLVWKFLEWRSQWLLMTSLRMMTVTGLFVRHVATMPRDKITDLGYSTNLPGQLLGYGTFHFESTGQDQELSTVHYVPRSDVLYRTLMAGLFQAGQASGGQPSAGREEADSVSPSRPTALPPSITPRRADDDPDAASVPRTQMIRIHPPPRDG